VGHCGQRSHGDGDRVISEAQIVDFWRKIWPLKPEHIAVLVRASDGAHHVINVREPEVIRPRRRHGREA